MGEIPDFSHDASLLYKSYVYIGVRSAVEGEKAASFVQILYKVDAGILSLVLHGRELLVERVIVGGRNNVEEDFNNFGNNRCFSLTLSF